MCRYKEDVTIDQYLQNIHGKTVALFRACCRIGAMESGCDERVSRMLESFGECLGYMFQMRDDLLDFVPDSSMIGKKAHQDFREGIYPLPVLLAREQPGGRRLLYPYMERSAEGTLTHADICRMEEIVAALGAWKARGTRSTPTRNGLRTSSKPCRQVIFPCSSARSYVSWGPCEWNSNIA